MTDEQAKLRAKFYPVVLARIESAIVDYERDTGEIVHDIGISMLDISNMDEPGKSLRIVTLSAYLPTQESDSAL